MASVAALLAALGPQLTPCWATLMRLVVPAAASSAALDLQQAPAGVALVALQWVWSELWLDPQQTSGEAALVALQWVWPELWLDPQQTSGEAAPLVMVASVAAQGPQLTPCWAALVRSVVPAAAS